MIGFVMSSRTRMQGVAAMALCLVTLALFGTDVRFVTVQPALLPDLDLSRGLAAFSGFGAEVLPSDNGGRELRLAKAPSAPAPAVIRVIPQPRRFTHIRVSAEIRTSTLEAGTERWQRAALIAPSFGARGERLGHWPYEIALIGWDTAWTRYSQILPVGDDVASMRLFAYVAAPAGVLAIRSVGIDGMAEAAWAPPVRFALCLAWGALGLWILAALFARWRPLTRPLSGVLAIMIVVFALYPQPHFYRLVRPINAVLFGIFAVLPTRDELAAALSLTWGDGDATENGRQRVPPERPSAASTGAASTGAASTGAAGQGPDSADAEPRGVGGNGATAQPADAPRPRVAPAPGLRIEPRPGRARGLFPDWLGSEDRGHIAAFAALAFVVRLGFPLTPWVALVAALLILGVSTEALQTFSPTRDSEFADLASDLIGILAGLGLGSAVLRGMRKISKKSNG